MHCNKTSILIPSIALQYTGIPRDPNILKAFKSLKHMGKGAIAG